MNNYNYNNYQPMYQNPNNFSAQAPRYNPPVQQPMITPIQGRIINSPDEVQQSELPMNGEWAFFPMSNGQEVYAMSWSVQNGVVKNRYTLGGDAQSKDFSDIMGKLDSIEALLKKNTYRNNYKKQYNNDKKGDAENA